MEGNVRPIHPRVRCRYVSLCMSSIRNVLAASWSEDGLLAILTRAAYTGPVTARVYDASDGFREIAKMAVPGDPSSSNTVVAFVRSRPDTLVTFAGTVAAVWNARSGELL